MENHINFISEISISKDGKFINFFKEPKEALEQIKKLPNIEELTNEKGEIIAYYLKGYNFAVTFSGDC